MGPIKYCDLSLPSPAENLACDEALLELAEQGVIGPLLRLWEPAHYFVAVGYANRASREVNLAFCERNNIPVLRRCSGGGAVLQGPGCFNYSLILPIADSSDLESIPGTNQLILKRHQVALAGLLHAPVEFCGQTDLAIGGLKFSGNSQRRKKNYLLFHGTLLLHLDFALMEKALPLPSRQPQYRLNRSHSDFLVNLKLPSQTVKTLLQQVWAANQPLRAIPFEPIAQLTRDKYEHEEWNLKFH